MAQGRKIVQSQENLAWSLALPLFAWTKTVTSFMRETFASCFASVSLHDESTSPVIAKPIELKKKARKTLSWESSVMAYSYVKCKSFGWLYGLFVVISVWFS